MKRLIIIIAFLVPFALTAQIKTFSPTGTRISYTPAVNIINSTVETTLFSDVIEANSLVPGKYYQFRLDLALSTPALNLANITIRVKYGSQTVAIVNGAALSIGATTAVPVTITGVLVSRGINSQFLPVTVSQGMGSILTLGSTNSVARGLMTVDASVDQNFSVTAQFSGVGGNACSLITDWVLRYDY